MNPRLRLLLRIAASIVLAAGGAYLMRDIWQHSNYEGPSPAEPVGPPALHLSHGHAFAIYFQISNTACACVLAGVLLLALSFWRRRPQP